MTLDRAKPKGMRLEGSESPTTYSASALAQAMREGRLDPVQVIEAHIKRIKSINPQLNALVSDRFEQARLEARDASHRLAEGNAILPPLLGVPITVKDALAVAGMPFTGGLRSRSEEVASQDAPAVARLRAAGAIILGKTNTPELSASVETENQLFGRTRNPWDPSRSPGGSSGGEAALIAAGGSPLGLGSDLAGSLRIPASYCGVAAFKPSAGAVSTEGHFPPDIHELAGWNAVGPIARRVDDLVLAFSVLSGREPKVEESYAQIHRIIIPAYPESWRLADPVRNTVTEAAQRLVSEGLELSESGALRLEDTAYEFVAHLRQFWLPEMLNHLGLRSTFGLAARLPGALVGLGDTSPNVLASLFMVAIFGAEMTRRGYGGDGLTRIRTSIVEQLGSNSLLLWPAAGSAAPRHGFPYGLTSGTVFSSVFNALGLPAAVVPAGFTPAGLPIGVQIAGPPGADELVLAAAARLETSLDRDLRLPSASNKNS